MKKEVKSTKELKELFPELSRTNHFKRRLDEVFEKGITFEIHIADKPFHAFTAKDGKMFKCSIGRNGRSFGFKRAYVTNNRTRTLAEIQANPENYRDVGDKWACKQKDLETGEWVEEFRVTTQIVNDTNWSELCVNAGKLISEELVEVECCGKCNGTGYIPGFAHVAEGVCFDCMGLGKWFIVKKEKV